MKDPIKHRIDLKPHSIFVWDTEGYICISYKNTMIVWPDLQSVKDSNFVTTELIKYFNEN